MMDYRFRCATKGPGLDADRIRYLESHDDNTAPRPGQGGLGLRIVRRLVSEVAAALKVIRPSAGGTMITLVIPKRVTEDLRHVI